MICPNCGAKIDELDPECPFCGHINEVGAEKEYMDSLYSTVDEMEDLPEQQIADIKNEVKKNTRLIGAVLAVILVIALLVGIGAGIVFLTHLYFNHKDEKEEQIAREWQSENFPVLDRMYAEEDYDGLADLFYDLSAEEDSYQYHLYEWKHYSFIDSLIKARNIRLYDENFENGVKFTELDYSVMLYDALWFYYRQYNCPFSELTEKECKILEDDGYPSSADLLYNRFGLSPGELEKKKTELVDKETGVLGFYRCEKYAKEIRERMEQE